MSHRSLTSIRPLSPHHLALYEIIHGDIGHASAAITASGGTPSAPRERVLYTGSWHAFKTIVQTEGAAALWSGLVPQLLGSVHVGKDYPFIPSFLCYTIAQCSSEAGYAMLWPTLIPTVACFDV
jgi:hypothetical protein